MRLISCHIENFGILSGKDFEFEPGLNLICLPNGSGKSTLAAFVRVMLYGFEEGARDDFKNERRRYCPWQGGVYGGSLKFETGGETYVLERTFGATAKKDGFSLRDEKTNLEYGGFSSVPGEVLFGLDSASFKRTVFISQSDCEAYSTDRINSRLGNMTDMSGDMDSFERADGALADLLNKMSPTRKTGSLYRLKDEIGDLERTVREGAALDDELETGKAKLLEAEETRDQLERRQKSLREFQDRAGKVNALIDIRKSYDEACAEYSGRKADFDKARGLFRAEPPEEPELKRAENNFSRINELKLRAAEMKPTPDETAELNELEKRRLPELEEIDQKISLCGRRSQLVSRIKAAEPQMNRTGAHRLALPAVIAGITAILSVAAFLILGAAAGAICAAIGAVIAAACLLVPKDRDAESQYKADKSELEEIDRELGDFIKKAGLGSEGEELTGALYKLKSEAERLYTLKEKRRRFEEEFPMGELSETESELNGFLVKHGIDGCGSADEGLRVLRQNLSGLDNSRRELERAAQKKDALEGREDFAEILAADPNGRVDMEGLIAEIREVSEELKNADSAVENLKRKQDGLRQKRDEIDGEEEELNEKKALLAREKKRYELLGETRSMLGKARENLTSRYMEPLLKGFRKYYSMMNGQDPEAYDIDAGISLGIHEAGERRELRFLSQGRRDLAGICLRMAMVEAIYQGEKPFVIFDDPFTNLDEVRTEGGLDFLKKLSREYQILYFTCHSGRAELVET